MEKMGHQRVSVQGYQGQVKQVEIVNMDKQKQILDIKINKVFSMLDKLDNKHIHIDNYNNNNYNN